GTGAQDVLQLESDERLGNPEQRGKLADHVAARIELGHFGQKQILGNQKAGCEDHDLERYQITVRIAKLGETSAFAFENDAGEILCHAHARLRTQVAFAELDRVLTRLDAQNAAQLVHHVGRLRRHKREEAQNFGNVERRRAEFALLVDLRYERLDRKSTRLNS